MSRNPIAPIKARSDRGLTATTNVAKRRPFWLPAPNYYILAVAVTIAAFFLLWGILSDVDESSPWIPAGITSGLLLLGAVFLREIFLRKYRERFLLVQKQLDRNLDKVPARPRRNAVAKLSIEQNAELVRRMKKKSAAAKTLMRLSEGHLEVFEFCSEYLELTSRELQNVAAGSPRIAAFRNGREVAEEIRRDHLLTWAELEAKRLTREAQSRVTIADKIETAQKAFDVLASALEHYPEDEDLNDSQTAIRELISSMRVEHWIEQAERAEFKGNYKRALSHYKDALFFMARDGNIPSGADAIAARINVEIERIQNLPDSKNIKREIPADE